MIPGGNATLKSANHTREQNDMRLAIATTDFPPMRGGIAALFSTLARACSERSHLTVLAPWSQTANIFDGQQPYRVIRIPGPPLLREAAFLRQLFTLDRTEGLDAVVCASWFPAGLVGYLLWVSHRVPYLVWAAGSDIVDDWRTPRRVVKSSLWPVKRLVLGHCAAIVAISRYTKTLVSEQGVSPGCIHVIPPAVDTNRFTPSPPSRAANSRYRQGAKHCLLTVARLDPHKGHSMVLRALATHLTDIPGIRYLIAGSGPEESTLRKLASSYGVERQVDFLGHVLEEDLPDLYRAADIFVMPSSILPGRLDYVEGFGIAYLEASASGKPVVAGRSGGSEDAVVDGVTGTLVNPDDPAAIARAIQALIQDPALSQRLGKGGREWVVRTLNLDSLAERVLALLKGTLQPQRHCGAKGI